MAVYWYHPNESIVGPTPRKGRFSLSTRFPRNLVESRITPQRKYPGPTSRKRRLLFCPNLGVREAVLGRHEGGPALASSSARS